MKKYHSLGELIRDYRDVYDISQIDFAIKTGVDIRTIQRWEKDETNIKVDMELEFVKATLLPFQLIRNLNTHETIPTYYDFKIRKYSLSTWTNDFPEALLLKYKSKESTNRFRTIDVEKDLDYVMEYMHFAKGKRRDIYKKLKAAIILLPELNLIINDQHGNYSGHSIMLPISLTDFNSIKNKEIEIQDLTINSFVNPKTQETPVFLNLDVTADCNDNFYFLLNQIFQYFKRFPNQNYIYSNFLHRYDSKEFDKQVGLDVAWEEPVSEDAPIWTGPNRFLVGNFNSFLKDYQ